MQKDSFNISDIIKQGRNMLRPSWKNWDHDQTDQGKGLKPPEADYKSNSSGVSIKLPEPNLSSFSSRSFVECAEQRKSIRKYSPCALSQNELSFLLWETAKIKIQRKDWSRRPIPSAGGRHCLKTYLYIDRVEGIPQGIYVYEPTDHKLLLINDSSHLRSSLSKALYDQDFGSAVIFIWTSVPYIMEYRYTTVAHKMIAFEAGHICQNLHLAAEAAECGCCAISAFYQEAVDSIVHVDGNDEFVLYIATIGKKTSCS